MKINLKNIIICCISVAICIISFAAIPNTAMAAQCNTAGRNVYPYIWYTYGTFNTGVNSSNKGCNKTPNYNCQRKCQNNTSTKASTEITTFIIPENTKPQPDKKPDVTTQAGTTVQKPVETTVNHEIETETTTQAVNNSYAQQILDLVNKERTKAGLKPLTLNSQVSQAAQIKSEDMMKNGYFSHTSPTYGTPFALMQRLGIKYNYAGENIAKGQKTPEAVVDAWMNSEGHRKNILNGSFKEMGIGYAKGGSTYWVQMFIG